MTPDYHQRFGALARLYGESALEKLSRAHVCIVGVGGVGSWTVEALARSGIGALTLIDLDDVCITNTNRQLPALDGQLGRPKIDVLAERIRLINPACRVTCHAQYFTQGTAEELLAERYDFAVDAIDKVAHKCQLILACRERQLPILTIGGAGGKRDGTMVRVHDLSHTEHDEMLRQLRRKLRREHDFPHVQHASWGIPAVFSPEKPVFPWADGVCRAEPEPDSILRLDCASGFGSACHVTAAFGLAAAGEVVRRIAAA
jgi:tRNA A37 threonylcarbamoyladenosine dehydratase